MTEIRGQRIYDETDIYNMLEKLNQQDKVTRKQIAEYVKQTEEGIDKIPLLNIISNLMEYNLDYLARLDSAVTDKFIDLMENFQLA